MATNQLTRNLKLIIEPNVGNTARYNLNRIDTIAEVFHRDSAGNLDIRAEAAINLLPNNINAGGSGSGGSVNFGSEAQPISTLTFFADTVDFGEAQLASETLRAQGATYYTDLKAASSGQLANLTFRLPANLGTNGQVLKTDGTGILSWVDQSGSGGINQLSAVWAPGDGVTKTITHNWGTRKVVVTVLDNSDDYREIEVEVSRPTDNTVQLVSSEVPGNNWTVLLQEVQ